MQSYTEPFKTYFSRPVAQDAAKSLSSGCEIRFQIFADTIEGEPAEIFSFTKRDGHNVILESDGSDPQLTFMLTHEAADTILSDTTENIGEIGVQIAKLLVSADPRKKAQVKVHAGILTLLSKGYLGVIASGGASFASFLASKGFGSLGAVKDLLNKLRKSG